MSPNPNANPGDGDDGPFDRLKRLIDALEELSERDGAVGVDVDYDVSVGSLGDLDDAARRPPGSKRTRHPSLGGAGPRGEESGTGGDAGPTRVVDADDLREDLDGSATDGYHVDVVEDGDRIELRADMPGVEDDDLSIAVEDGDVVVSVDGEAVERVPTGWAAGVVRSASFNNGVLFVELEREGAGDEADADDGGDDGSGDDGSAGGDGPAGVEP